MRRLSVGAVLIAAVSAIAGAQRPAPGAAIDIKGFGYAREIPAGDGLTTITLDAAALSHTTLDAIRIVDGSGRQVPYVIRPATDWLELTLPALEPVSAPANIDPSLPRDATKRTWYRARLGFAGLPDAVLRLSTDARVFRREITVTMGQSPRDAPPRVAMTRVVGDAWLHDDPATPVAPLDISLPGRSDTDSLFVLVDDGDNEKLPIVGAMLRVPTYRLSFFRDSAGSARVVYGRPGLAAPRYDMSLIAGRLADSAATAVELGPEQVLADSESGVPRVVFWGVLAATVAVLLGLIARLVRGGAGAA